MRFKHIFGVPLCGALALLAIAGCADDELLNGQGDGRPKGNGIVFGASANYAGPITRVVYGDYTYEDGHEGDYDSRLSQAINWEEDDQVSIYSPTSPTIKQVDYDITKSTNGQENLAYLAAIDGQDGLHWGSGTQDFYAVYPSKASMQNQEMANQFVSFENGVLNGFIPVNQQQHISYNSSETDPAKRWTVTPNYDWLWMAAINKGFTVPTDGTDGGINLDFVPLTTTLEITFVGPTTVPLVQFNVRSKSKKNIVGQFTCDLKQGSTTQVGNYSNIPKCQHVNNGTVNEFATVNMSYINEEGEREEAINLAEGEEITFNVYLLPVENLTDVTVRVAGYNSSSKTVDLGSLDVRLQPHQKTCVKIAAPQISAGGTNTWIDGIPDNALVSQLSIPGTANTFSYLYEGNDKEQFKAQESDIVQQWNAGIRCFELVSDVNGSGDNLDGAQLLCNRQALGITFGQAVDQIWQLVNSSNGREFAMIIPSYGSGIGHPSDGNGVLDYANDLNQFYRTHTGYKYVTYDRNLTVGQARGGLIFVARITSEEDADRSNWIGTMPEPVEGVFVDEWGSLVDNWARRGYTLQDGTVVNNWARSLNDQNSVEYYMRNILENSRDDNSRPDQYIRPSWIPSRDESKINFIHSTTRKGGGAGSAYIHDWRRVVPEEGVVDGLRPGSFFIAQTSETRYEDWWWYDYYFNHYAYWDPSLQEKKDDIWNTFIASIDANSQDTQAEQFYINSLDGYFVDPTIQQSYLPFVTGSSVGGVGLGTGGIAGNIQAYANYINDWFYNEIQDFGENNIYGPMNVVLLDMVYQSTGGSRLPSTIINNNYRFQLKTADDFNGGTDTNNSSLSNSGSGYGNGGALIK